MYDQTLCPADSNGPLADKKIDLWVQRGEMKYFVAEHKIDGSRYLLHLHKDGHALTSRRISVKTGTYSNKINNVKHFKKLKISDKLDGTVLDGEVCSTSMRLNGPGGVSGTLNSTPKNAAASQEEFGPLQMLVFNILRWRGKDVTQRPFKKRRKLARAALKMLYALNPSIKPLIRLVQQFPLTTKEEINAAYKAALKDGFEGVMIKDLRAVDGEGMYKKKVFRDTCVIISGMIEGTGKYKGTLGALLGEAYDEDGNPKEVAKISGMTDEQRHDMWKNKKKWTGKIIEVLAQEMGAKGRLRHPRFVRERDDYPKHKVTIEKIRKDLALI